MIAIPIWLLCLLVGLVLLLALMLYTNLREREFRVRIPGLDSFEQALPSIAGMTRAAILDGNRVDVLQNGDGFFPALLQAIAAAEESIHFETYVWWTGDILVGERYFPRVEPAGPTRAHVLHGAPLGGVSDLELMFKMSIATAQRELLIQNPYFIPDPQTVALLERAVARGVEVKIMVPGSITDSPVVRHAGHHHWDEMLGAGVRIFEHQKTLIHQKIMIIDGLWAHVGSTNLDDRSFDINEEAGVGVIDERVAAELKAAFAADLESCTEVDLRVWEGKRTRLHRAVDGLCYLLSGQL